MLRFEIQTKRRVYVCYVEFRGRDLYELDIVLDAGTWKRKSIGEWFEISIGSDPVEFAKEKIAKYELMEDYIEKYDDKVIILDDGQAAELVKQVHEVEVNDWTAGQKGVVRWETAKTAKETKKKGSAK